MEPTYQSANITFGPDHCYHWTHELNMYTNPTLLITVYKFFGVVILICWLLLSSIIIFSEGLEGVWGITKGISIIIPIFLVLGLIAYYIIALMYGGKYIVKFTMNEKEIVHEQEIQQQKKAQKLGCIIAVLGLFSKNPGRVGQGLLVASHSTTTSKYKTVKTINGKRKRNVIYVNQTLTKNQVYVADEDYDFVYEYISSRCVNAKIK